MTRDTLQRSALRAVALAIAIAAFLDPAITSERRAKRVVIVSAGDSARDSRLADRVADILRARFAIARTPVAGASAAVVVGDILPREADNVPVPSFVVVADSSQAAVAIDRVDAPSSATMEERVPVRALVSVRGSGERSLDLTIRVGGAVVDRVSRRVTRDTTLVVPMSFVPTSSGPVAVRVTASLGGGNTPAVSDAAVNVVSRRRAVLFYDPRPSWISTFVRRAVEGDPQFSVTSRIVTSRDVGTSTGRPPGTLGDRSALTPFDAIVIGAPQLLSTTDVNGLEAFMRRRGGSVIFLLDDASPGRGPYERLSRTSNWSASRGTPMTFSRGDSTTLRAGEVVVPAELPAASTAIAIGPKTVVWEAPVGAGRLIVSGALDAWRFRDPASSTFDRFWRTVIADAAASAPPPMLVETSPSIVEPGDAVDVRATLRDVALDSSAARSGSVRATLSGPAASESQIRLWPEGETGRFSTTLRAPREPGVYRFTVASSGRTAEVPLIVSPGVRDATPWSYPLASAWASSRGGRIFRARDMGKLPAALDAAAKPRVERLTWHPFRSAWWIVPFVLALSVEWWLRRRRGLR